MRFVIFIFCPFMRVLILFLRTNSGAAHLTHEVGRWLTYMACFSAYSCSTRWNWIIEFLFNHRYDWTFFGIRDISHNLNSAHFFFCSQNTGSAYLQLSEAEEQTVCYLVNTAEYCYETSHQLCERCVCVCVRLTFLIEVCKLNGGGGIHVQCKTTCS